MMSRAWLVGLILAVPLVGVAVAKGLQAHLNSELRTALIRHHPDANPAAVAKITLDRICEEPPVGLRKLCSMNHNLNLIHTASIGAGCLGLFLLVSIRVAGTLARKSRRLLLWVFKPGLYLTAIALIALVLVHAGIAMAALYYGESALVGRIHPFVIGAVGLGAFYGVAAIARNAFRLVRTAKTFAVGKTFSRSEALDLWDRVGGIADRLGALRPENVVLGLDPNFFVTEADVVCLGSTCVGRTLYCSLPLMRIITPTEFDGIIGHELGHFKGLDTKFSQEFFPIYRGTADAIAALQETGQEGARAVALLPAIAVFGYFLESFSLAESGISRERELAADKEGAEASDTRCVASALVKVHAFSGTWKHLQQAAAEALEKGKMLVNASRTYAEAVTNCATPNALEGLAHTHLSHPTDSHPPLGIRLASLGISMEDIQADALNVNPESTAIGLVPEPEKGEEEISKAYQVILAERLGIDIEPLSDAADAADKGRV